MRRYCLWAVMLWVCGPLVSIAAEKEVTFGDGLEGKLAIPSDAVGKAVLLLHGFNGEMDEVGNLYADVAAELSKRGIASLRFNFTGEGERVNFLVTSTYDSRVAQASAAYEYLHQQVPQAKLGVLGFSLGGLTAMGVVGAAPDWFDSMVLWSAAQEMDFTRTEISANAARQAVTQGQGVLKDWTDITLTKQFVLSYVGVHGAADLAKFQGHLLALRGDKDFLPAADPGWLASAQNAKGKRREFVLISGADHIYNVLEQPRPGYGQRVVGLTAAWFDETL